MKHRLALIAFSFILISNTVFAQDGAPPVPVRVVWSTTAVPAGSIADLAVVFDVPKGHHITDVENGLFFVQVPDTLGLTFGEPVFPPGERYHEERAYRGRTIVRLPVTASDSAAIGKYSLLVAIGYQICREFGDETCFLPEERTLSLAANIVGKGIPVELANADIFGAPAAAEALSLEDRLIAALNKGSWVAFLLVFAGGILASFTPCVYPVIPITIGYIGGASRGKPLRGLGLSAIFVLGIALIYSSLGLISAATGTLFGSFSGSPIVIVTVAAIFFLMGLSMLGAFDISLPSSFQTKLQTSGKGRGLLGPLLIGMVSGLVIAPCIGPIIVALLAWVSKTGNLFYGWALLFVFSLGLGVLFLVIGTFSGAIQALPKAGMWMENIKKGFGWILFAAALYLLRFVLPPNWFTLSWAVLLIVFAVFSGAFDSLTAEAGSGKRLWKAFTLIVFLIGAILLFRFMQGSVSGPAATAKKGVEWMINEEEKALTEARNQNKPLVLDFYADWCAACVELDEKTYSVPEVIQRLDGFVRLKFDFTKETSWVREMKNKYRIAGMPTVILLNASGTEIGRFTGFKSPRDFAAFLDRNNL